MSEFRFTNDQWRVYQDLPEQGISHRHWLEHVVNSWLAERDRQVAEKVLEELETELVGSMEDGTYLAPWTELTANEIREKIWELFDSHRKEQDDE